MFRTFKCSALKTIRRTRNDYVNNILQTGLETGTTKPLWKFFKSQRQDNVGVSPLKHQGTLHTDSTAKANILNRLFQSVFTKEDLTEETKSLQGCPYQPLTELKSQWKESSPYRPT